MIFSETSKSVIFQNVDVSLRAKSLCHLNFGKHASVRAQIRSVPRSDKYLCIEPDRKNYALRIHQVFIAQIMPQRGKMTVLRVYTVVPLGTPFFDVCRACVTLTLGNTHPYELKLAQCRGIINVCASDRAEKITHLGFIKFLLRKSCRKWEK